MAVTTTQPTSKTLNSVLRDNPNIKFKLGSLFKWSSTEGTVTYKNIKRPQDMWQLLHELAHAKLGHNDYKTDVDIIKMESAAWGYAKDNLAPSYAVDISYDFIEDSLDTYRQWLHKRSSCPQCKQTGVQQNQNTYSCINCRCSWRVNESRLCGLRRVII